jgi:hypothetical protein
MRNAFRIRIHGDQCVYCGEHAASDEHFPPASYGNLGFLLPACRECNSFAGTAHPLNFVKRSAYVKEQIKSHAPRFTFTSETTLQDILARPEGVWLTEMRAEKRKLGFRNRFNWDSLAYIATIQTRRYRFIPDMSHEVDEEFEELQALQDVEVAQDAHQFERDAEQQEVRLAMQEAHREELLESLVDGLPKFQAHRKKELLLDEDMEFLASETYYGGHLTDKQFESLLVLARREEVSVEPADIQIMKIDELIALIKQVNS